MRDTLYCSKDSITAGDSCSVPLQYFLVKSFKETVSSLQFNSITYPSRRTTFKRVVLKPRFELAAI